MLGQIISAFEDALPAIASALVIGLAGWLIKSIKKSKFSISKFMKEHQTLVEHQDANTNKIQQLVEDNIAIKQTLRNDVKSHIVSLYERCLEKGYITPMELETVNRLNDSYHNVLNGNTYIHVIVKQMNNDFPIRGTEIPEH